LPDGHNDQTADEGGCSYSCLGAPCRLPGGEAAPLAGSLSHSGDGDMTAM
jgi:hypothetical protein